MDIVYLYTPSQWEHELRFSLRSIEKYFKEFNGNIFIIGPAPTYINKKKVKVIDYTDNIYPEIDIKKRLFISNILAVTNNYIFFNDDFFINKNVTEEDFKKNYILEDLNTVKRGDGLWRNMLWKTYDLVKTLGGYGYNHETHSPKIFNKEIFKNIAERVKPYYDNAKTRYDGLCSDTLYFELLNQYESLVENKKYDAKEYITGFYEPINSIIEIEKMLENKTFFYCDENGLTQHLKAFLYEKFPEKSKYEV